MQSTYQVCQILMKPEIVR